MVTKRLFDSAALYKYGIKKEALGVINDKIYGNWATNTFVASSSYAVGTHVTNDAEINDAVCVKNYPGSGAGSLADAIAKGYFVKSGMAVLMKNPLEVAEAERQKALQDFILQVKRDIEEASFATEGNSFNGNTVGAEAEDGLVLIVPKGMKPLIDTELLSGAFNLDKLAIPAQVIVVDEILDKENGLHVFGMLLDPRMVSLHTDYQAIREQENAEGDFKNIYMHLEHTCHISNNTFCKAYSNHWNQ